MIHDHDLYIKTLCLWGRKWMLSALHRIGLKQGWRTMTDEQLAEVLYAHAKANQVI
jgi:hypothetical protein